MCGGLFRSLFGGGRQQQQQQPPTSQKKRGGSLARNAPASATIIGRNAAVAAGGVGWGRSSEWTTQGFDDCSAAVVVPPSKGVMISGMAGRGSGSGSASLAPPQPTKDKARAPVPVDLTGGKKSLQKKRLPLVVDSGPSLPKHDRGGPVGAMHDLALRRERGLLEGDLLYEMGVKKGKEKAWCRKGHPELAKDTEGALKRYDQGKWRKELRSSEYLGRDKAGGRRSERAGRHLAAYNCGDGAGPARGR